MRKRAIYVGSDRPVFTFKTRRSNPLHYGMTGVMQSAFVGSGVTFIPDGYNPKAMGASYEGFIVRRKDLFFTQL